MLYKPLLSVHVILHNFTYSTSDIYSVSIKENSGLKCSEKYQLDQIQNGRLSAIINFTMPDI